MERRSFLRWVAGVSALQGWNYAATAIEAGPDAVSDFPPDDYQAPGWLRYSRTVYVDGYSPPLYPHMRDFNAQRLVEIGVKLGGDTFRFQPIGYWAYYPSKVFRVHPELGSRNLIEEMAQECRRAGVHVYCYTGYAHPHMEVGWVDQHPQYAGWVLRDPEGRPYGTYWHYGWTLRQKLCTTGDAYRAAMRTVVRELCQHDIDGIYFDAPGGWGYKGICFCDSCRRNFKNFSGMDMERLSAFVRLANRGLSTHSLDWERLPSDADTEALATWYRWANQLIREDLLDFRKIIHASGKFMLCHNGNTWDGASLPLQYRIPEGFMIEHSTQIYQRIVTGLMGASMGRPYKKLAQMYVGSYTVSNFQQPPHSDPWVVHNTNLEDGDETRMEGFTNLACGNAPIYVGANRLYFHVGSGSPEPAKEVFELTRHAEPILKDSIPLPYVAIVPTWESLQLWRSRRRSWNVMMSEGFGLAMLDEGISFDVNPSTEMTEEWLERQHVVALCGASGVSQADARKLAAWVQRGGSLLATYDTGLYDEQGKLRPDGGVLKETLGVDITGEPLESQPECYYRVQRAHPALGENREGTVVQGDGRLVPVKARAGATVLADCWNLGTDESRGPAIVFHEYGKGRTIYVSGSLEAHYTSSRVPSIKRLLGTIVRYLGGGTALPFKLSAPRGVYGVARRTSNGDLVLWVLANIGFKDADVGRMRQDFVPVPDVRVSIRVPEGQQVNSVHLVRARRNVPFELDGGYVTTKIPTLHIAELVHVELVRN